MRWSRASEKANNKVSSDNDVQQQQLPSEEEEIVGGGISPLEACALIGSLSTLTESFLNRVICDSNRYGNSYRSLVWFLRHKLFSIVFFQHVTTTFFLMLIKFFFSSFLFYQRVNDKDFGMNSSDLFFLI